MRKSLASIARRLSSAKLVTAFVAVAGVATLSSAALASASPSYFSVAKPTSQKICYARYGTGWQAAGFKNLDHCLRYVSTPAPTSKDDCNYGYWYVYGFNAFSQCAAWVAEHGGGYGGTATEYY